LTLNSSTLGQLDEPRIDSLTAWRRGEIVLEKTPLREAVEELNRYQQKKLVISSPNIGELQISGIYHVGDGAGFAQTIAKLYRLRVSETEAEIRLSGSSSGNSDL
jgi:transmembrane sensor